MPYIGRDLNRGNYLKLDDISSSFNGSTQTFNLTVGGSAFTPGSAFSILVSVGGVIQEPESAYQVNNSEITFANAPTAQDSFFCIALGVALGIGVPGNGTVNGTQMSKPFNYDGFFYLNDGTNRVGINSSIPSETLDIVGNTKISGIVTATSFSGPLSNASGISTFYDLKVTNNLTVEGTTTTLDTNLIGVDRIEVGANSNSVVGVAITQSGTADIVNLFDGGTEIVEVASSTNAVKVTHSGGYGLRVQRGSKFLDFNGDWATSGNAAINAGASGIRFYYGDSSDGIQFNTGSGGDKVRITSTGDVGIGTTNPFTTGALSSHQLTIKNDNPVMGIGKNNSDMLYLRREFAAGNYSFQTFNGGNTGFFLIQPYGGKVGIGTNNPLRDFHVTGTSRFEQLDVVGFATFGSSGTKFYHHTPKIEMPGTGTATIGFFNATTGTTNNDGMLLGFSSSSQVGFINVNEASHGFVLKTGSSAQSSERLRISGVGTVSIRNGTEEMVNAKPNAAVELYHNGSKKFETTNTGVTVHGDLAASQDYPNFRPTLDLNFAAERKLDPRITYSRNGLASFVNEFGKVVLIGNNVPRFDYDPITRERKGLLIELQRTNLFTYSSEFDQINWSNVRTTDSKTVATNDPQGLQTAFKLIANTDNNTHRLDKINLSMSTSTVYTMSVWAKAAEYTGVSLTIADSSNNSHGVYFDLSAGTFTIGSNAHTGRMEAYPNGWYRCFATFTTPSTINFNQCLIGVLQNGTTHTYTGNGSSGIYIWGAQLEQGAFETSYIHTSAATETRGADLVSIEGEEFSEFYNQTEGSFVSEIMLKPSWPLSGYASITLTLSDNSYNNRITLASSTGSAAFNADVTISGSTSRASLGSYTSGSHSIKAALAYKASDSAGSLNGAAAVTSSPGTLPLLTRADIGKDHNNGNLLNGHIKRIMYYSHRLPNSQLVTLTS